MKRQFSPLGLVATAILLRVGHCGEITDMVRFNGTETGDKITRKIGAHSYALLAMRESEQMHL